MAFEIRNPQGVPVPFNELNREVCELWDQPVEPEHYARPPFDASKLTEMESAVYNSIDWLNIIGSWIERGECKSWDDFRNAYCRAFDRGWEELRQRRGQHHYLVLVDFWDFQGYTPFGYNSTHTPTTHTNSDESSIRYSNRS